MLLARFLNGLITVGTLTVVDAGGRTHRFTGTPAEPAVTIRLHDKALHRLLGSNPDLHLGEAYMYGTLTVEDGSLYDFMDLIGRNYDARGLQGLRRSSWLWRLARRFQQFNPAGWARANVAHHYDLSGDLYDLFLDGDRQYSCAYFPTGDENLEQAQEAKKRHIAAKLLMQEPGLRVLDIGSGWGGMGLYLANEFGAEVTGVTLSTEQHKLSNQRARDAGLADRARFLMRDYRHQDGRFDRIVSVGMFEHVGVNHFHEFFAKIRQLLADDGVALLHTIGRMEGRGTTNSWIRKHIFPGGYVPALSEITPAIEAAGLWTTDVEVLRLHYAETLRHWRERFLANRETAKALYDETFCRMWEFYLVASEISFRYLGNAVFQIQLARRQDAVPLTRDYITDFDRQKRPATVRAAE